MSCFIWFSLFGMPKWVARSCASISQLAGSVLCGRLTSCDLVMLYFSLRIRVSGC